MEIVVGLDGTVIVRDEGAGIPPDRRDLMLQRFWRGDRRSIGSAGLDLSIVTRVVKAHGGSISVTDALVQGLGLFHQAPASGDAVGRGRQRR